MTRVILRVKKLHPDAILPSYAHPGDSGLDIYSVEDVIVKAGKRAIVHTGIAMEYPDNYCTLIWDKSGLAGNSGITVLGGVFENIYKGEYKIILFNTSEEDYFIKKGSKIAQILVQPIINADVEEVQELNDSIRGVDGFGSTGLEKKAN
jgi:dUTP pyrophosphatase